MKIYKLLLIAATLTLISVYGYSSSLRGKNSNIVMGASSHRQASLHGAQLQTIIQSNAAAEHHGDDRHIQPGTPMNLKALVKNVGKEASAPGEIYLRFAFPKPLHQHKHSNLFQTEAHKLPSLKPGEEIEISFEKTHHWPSLFDFIRQDWGMRQYEAVVKIGKTERVTGTLVITFSAFYYEGPARAIPAEVPQS